MAADLVIRGGRVVDGTGAPSFEADVAISNGRIYVRSTTEAACLDVAPKALPPLKLIPSLAAANGFRLLIVNVATWTPGAVPG